MRRPVRINYLWHVVGNLKVLIPATDGEIEEQPGRGQYQAQLSWVTPDGEAGSRRLTGREMEKYFLFRQLEYTDTRPDGERVDLPPQR